MKISDLKYSDIMLRTTKQDLEKIVFAEDADTLPQRCEVGIVFGGVSMIPHRVDKAVDLYHEGMLERILVTGGIGYLNTDRRTPEALKMQEYLISKDIPQYAIITEDASRNSLENVINSLELLSTDYNDLDAIRLALITSDFHVRRCRGMMAFHTNNSDLYGVGTIDGITDKDNWSKTLQGQRRIVQEAISLCHYVKTNRMQDETISGISLTRRLKK